MAYKVTRRVDGAYNDRTRKYYSYYEKVGTFDYKSEARDEVERRMHADDLDREEGIVPASIEYTYIIKEV